VASKLATLEHERRAAIQKQKNAMVDAILSHVDSQAEIEADTVAFVSQYHPFPHHDFIMSDFNHQESALQVNVAAPTILRAVHNQITRVQTKIQLVKKLVSERAAAAHGVPEGILFTQLVQV
jgi:hypothetical protein